ncbi:MAG: SPOR domain-containing protein [Bacteroidota bacterium]
MIFSKSYNYLKTALIFLLLFLFSNWLFAQEVVCERKITSKNNSEILIEIQIAKNSITGFGKIEEVIPVGFTPKLIDKANGVYSFVDGKVKFLWMELPNSPTLKVSYKLSGIGVNLITLTGNFSYLINEQSLKSEIKTVTQLKPNENLIANKITEKTNNTTVVTSKTNTSENKTVADNKLPAKAIYKVQIGAYKDSKWKHDYTNIKSLSSDKSGDFTRYYSGSFKTLQEAENHQKELAKKGYIQTFVVYFVGSVRYTLPQ